MTGMKTLLLGTCGVGRSSDGSLDVIQNNSMLYSTRRHSSLARQDGTLSVADSTDGHGVPFAMEQVTTSGDSCMHHHDSSTAHSVSETSRRSSAAVDLNCSVVDAVSRNRCSRIQNARRKSLNESGVANLLVAGLHNSEFETSSEHWPRSAWRRTKSYDMSGCEVTVL